jgi:hypothetical protein
MLTRRKKPQQFSSGVEFAVSAGLLLYRQQTPSAPPVLKSVKTAVPPVKFRVSARAELVETNIIDGTTAKGSKRDFIPRRENAISGKY